MTLSSILHSYTSIIVNILYYCPRFVNHSLFTTPIMTRNSLFFLFSFLLSFASRLQGQTAERDLFDKATVHDVSIRFGQTHWSDSLDSLRIYGDEMITATVVVDGMEYKEAGVRYRSGMGYSMGNARNPMLIELDMKDKTRNYHGVKHIKLSNAYKDPSLIREVLGYEIAGKYFPCPRAGFVNLTINGDNRGVFVNVEDIDSSYLVKHFGTSHGSLFEATLDSKPDVNNTECGKDLGSLNFEPHPQCLQRFFKGREDANWSALETLTKILKEDEDHAGTVINLDKTLWMLAFNNLTANLMSYTGQHSANYFLYEDKSNHFAPILSDLNMGFGGFKNTGVGGDLTLEALQDIDPLLHIDNVNKPLISQILKNEEYKKVYLSHIRQMWKDYFENGVYLERAKALQAVVAPYFMNSVNKGEFSSRDFQNSLTSTVGTQDKIPGVVELMSKRAQFLKSNAAVSIIPPDVSNVDIAKREKFAAKKVTDFRIVATIENFPKKVRLYYRPSAKDSYTSVEMFDDGASGDGKIGDKIFGVIIDPKGKFSEIEYFIIAENVAAIGYDPPNYMFVRRKASLEDLNR